MRQLTAFISIPVPCLRCCPGCVSPGTLPGAAATQTPRPTSTSASARANASPPGIAFSTRIASAGGAHPEQAHDPEREQREHQAEAAADADGAVLDAHPQGAEHTGAPAHQEVQRRAAVPQARGLERRQLIQARDGERPACHPRPVLVPGQE